MLVFILYTLLVTYINDIIISKAQRTSLLGLAHRKLFIGLWINQFLSGWCSQRWK